MPTPGARTIAWNVVLELQERRLLTLDATLSPDGEGGAWLSWSGPGVFCVVLPAGEILVETVEERTSVPATSATDAVDKLADLLRNRCRRCGKMPTVSCKTCLSVRYCSRDCEMKHHEFHLESCEGPITREVDFT